MKSEKTEILVNYCTLKNSEKCFTLWKYIVTNTCVLPMSDLINILTRFQHFDRRHKYIYYYTTFLSEISDNRMLENSLGRSLNILLAELLALILFKYCMKIHYGMYKQAWQSTACKIQYAFCHVLLL